MITPPPEHPGAMAATFKALPVASAPARPRVASPMPGRAGVLRLRALPGDPRAGQPVRLEVIDAPSSAHGYRWQAGGDTTIRRSGPDSPQSIISFGSPGAHTVSVRALGGDATYVGSLLLTARPAASAGPKMPTKPRPAQSRRSATLGGAFVPMVRGARALPKRSVAHAASDPAVTIVDFRFSPATTTVHVGDTVTWTNDGSMPHSATARDGSFDTGVLNRGHSASHTFTQAGTFSYFCKVHPFMHGTIVVLAKASTPPATHSAPSSPSPPSTASTSTPTSSAAASPPAGTAARPETGATLPVTGMNLIGGLAAGLLLLGSGIALRRMPAIQSSPISRPRGGDEREHSRP